MPARQHGLRGRLGRSAIALGALAAAMLLAGAARAGPFDFFFGGRQSAPARPFANPFAALFGTPAAEPRPAPSESGPATAFCVRLCDGRYFPLQRHAGTTPVAMCNAFCPASRVKVFAGGGIERAVANDGSRYEDLENAYAYRKKLVPSCTCNGKDPVGLARVDPATDPTLRPGDVVATPEGLVAYQGPGGGRSGPPEASFTPVASSTRLPSDTRQQLLELKVAPSSGAPDTTSAVLRPSTDDGRRAELTR